MAAPTYESILKEFKNKVYHPVYFLHGDEPYFIDQLAEYIEEHVLTDSEKEFNQTILYGRDVDMATVISNAKRYPMMANYQVVIVREAQDVKDLLKKRKGEGEDDEEEPEFDQFAEYLKNPQKSTILVFCYKHKKVDKRTKTGKLIEKQTVFFESKTIFDNKLPAWISSYVKSKGYNIKADATFLLAEYLGTDLSKVVNELEKIMINVNRDTEINSTHIEKNIGISKDFNVFELQNALGVKNTLKIFQIVNYLGKNSKNNPLVVVLSTLFQFFNKIITYHVFKGKPGVNLSAALGVHPFFLKDYETAARNFSAGHAIYAIGLIHEFDLKLKGVQSVGVSEHDLLREMIYKILHPEFAEA
jgi:DNA polymerase-3 subunit delta